MDRGVFDTTADKLAVQAAQDRANRHGYGYVAVSPRRYIVIFNTGAGASRTGSGPWRAFVSYSTLTRPVNLSTASRIVSDLDAAAEASESGRLHAVDDAYHKVLSGPYGRNWR